MEYQQLGTSALKISKISFGAMSLKPEACGNERIIHEAIGDGINYFDTADLYNKGENETLLGKALKEKRKEILIATKVGNQWREDGSGWDWNPHKNYIVSAVENSLTRLQTDYIDLYQLHGGTIEDPILETIEAFELLKQQGKIRHYGISSIRPNVIKKWVKHSNIISVMLQYSLLDRRPEENVLPLLKENNIGVLARGSLAQGLLIDKPAKEYLQYKPDEVKKANMLLHSISNKRSSPAQIALQFVLQHPAVTSAVVGIRTPVQLKEAVEVLNTHLSDEENDALKNVLPLPFYKEHR